MRVSVKCLLPPIIAIILLVCLSLAQAGQVALDYTGTPKTFKVCCLALEQNAAPPSYVNSHPLIFEGLRRSPEKPAGWDFDNPLAQAMVVSGSGTISKADAAYWTVNLTDATASGLVGLDLIYICAPLVEIDSEVQRDALIKAVRSGTILWIDQADISGAGSAVTALAPPGPAAWVAATPPPFAFDTESIDVREAANSGAWMLQNPCKISPTEAAQIGRYPFPSTPTNSPSNNVVANSAVSFHRQSIVQVRNIGSGNAYPQATFTPYGAGGIVVTAGEVGWDLEWWWRATGAGWTDDWWRAQNLRRPNRAQLPDFKFAYNILASTSRWSASRRAPSADAYSAIEVRPPLQIDWQFPGRFDAIDVTDSATFLTPVVSAPVCAGGRVFVITVGSPGVAGGTEIDSQLLCFDADPAQDLDGDGTSDDGVLDYSAGLPYDLIWRIPMAATGGDELTPRYSAPCVADLYDFGGIAHRQVVLVSLVDPMPGGIVGEVRCYDFNGGLIWTRELEGYDDSTAGVVALSTPVVHDGYVYVLASEFDNTLDGAAGSGSVKDTYGRAHCFQIDYAWDPTDDDGVKWVFPDPDIGPGANTFEELAGILPAFHEPQWVAGIDEYHDPGLFPRPLLPPTRGPVPVVHSGLDTLGTNAYQTVLSFATPVRPHFTVNAGAWESAVFGWANLLSRDGGCDFSVIPTPVDPNDTDDPPADWLNAEYFRIRLKQGVPGSTTIGSISRVDQPTVVPPGFAEVTVDTNDDGADDAVEIRFASQQAREFLLPLDPAGVGALDPATVPLGVDIQVVYDIGAGAITETHALRGPILYRTNDSDNRRHVTSAVVTGADSMIVASDAAEDEDRNLAPDANEGTPVRSISRTDGSDQWVFYPDTTLPHWTNLSGAPWNLDAPYDRRAGDPGYASLCKSAPAFDGATKTAYVAVTNAQPDPSNGTTLESISEVVGIATEMDLSITLRCTDNTGTRYPDARLVDNAATYPITVTTLDRNYENAVTIPQSRYSVDFQNHVITFLRERAGWISGTIGSLYGKPLWVTYWFHDDPADVSSVIQVPAPGERHVLADIVRFQYMPGFIRLRHNMVDWDSISMYLPNGTAIYDWGLGEHLLQTANLMPGWANGLPRGILDIRALYIPTSWAVEMPLQPGCNFVVQYNYLDEFTGNEAADPAVEIHQMPYDIGEAISAPAVGGRVLHIGTEGLDFNRDNAIDYTELHDPSHARKPFLVGDRIRETLVSLLWDPISNLVHGHTAQPAIAHGSYYADLGSVSPERVIPAVSSPPVIGHKRVYVGSKLVSQIAQPASSAPAEAGYVSEGVGFVSALKSQSTFICDDTRIIEVIDGRPVWACHGTVGPIYDERVDTSRGTDGRIAIPFSRPAKAVRLSNGHLLVVDTGNNRVVEIDRDGLIKWPLTAAGYDLYNSRLELNRVLQLDSPSDVFRYYRIVDTGVSYNSPNGDLLPFTETHTVIADAGNARVIDIVTTVNTAGQQSHSVRVVTPSHVKAAGGAARLQRISYTAARPIFDPSATATPGNVVHPVIGYLCAASNLHQLLVVEAHTLAINPPSVNQPYGGAVGSNWNWLAWLWDPDLTDAVYGPSDSLIFRNIRGLQTSYEGGDFYVTVTCGQYAGRRSSVQDNQPHALAQQGDGVFEFCADISGAAGTWALMPAIDGGGGADPDTPIWYMTRENYLYSYPGAGTRRDLANIRYVDVNATAYWQTMPWFPVSAVRLPCDNRPMDANSDGMLERYCRHLVTNYADLIPNLRRDTIADTTAPASLYSSVIVVQTDDRNNDYPGDDVLDIDRRLVIPNPNEADWNDPLAQPTHAAQ